MEGGDGGRVESYDSATYFFCLAKDGNKWWGFDWLMESTPFGDGAYFPAEAAPVSSKRGCLDVLCTVCRCFLHHNSTKFSQIIIATQSSGGGSCLGNMIWICLELTCWKWERIMLEPRLHNGKVGVLLEHNLGEMGSCSDAAIFCQWVLVVDGV